MPVTINGTTGITYPDNVLQPNGVPAPGTSGNVAASNGTAWTSGGLSTTAVLNATAGATAGAVGTYVYARTPSNPTQVLGDTIAGSSLQTAPMKGEPGTYYAAHDGPAGSYPTLSGTWRCMGRALTTNINTYFSYTLWLRIS